MRTLSWPHNRSEFPLDSDALRVLGCEYVELQACNSLLLVGSFV